MGGPSLRPSLLSRFIMIDSIMTYLAENKAVVVGAVATVLEVATLVINFWRQNKSNKVKPLGVEAKGRTKLQNFLWAANPINLFRKP